MAGRQGLRVTVLDATERATVASVEPVNRLLGDIGLRTTKSVLPVAGEGSPVIGGSTCDDPSYRAWTLELQAQGFEIGYHRATSVTAPRATIARALDRFREIYGHDPMSMADHSGAVAGQQGARRIQLRS